MDSNERDQLASLAAASDQLSAMASLVAQPIAAIYKDLTRRGLTDYAATHLTGVFLANLMPGSIQGDE